jgi:transforming growth factor-beta-induced protein
MQFMRFSLALLFAANVDIVLADGHAAKAEKDIVDTAVAAGKFGILAEALTKADLVDTLKGTGPFTVFAPTDDAFAAALKALKITKEQLLARADLKSILLYHVVSGSVKSTALSDGMTPATVQGTNLKVSITGDVVKVNTAKVTSADVMASNGVIHIIDAVLLPPDIVDTAVADGRFTILAEALTKAKLVDDLKGTGPFTVFAPTDAAFAAALKALGATKEELLARKDLKSILEYHVLSGSVKSTDLSNGIKAKTVQGCDATITIDGSTVKVNDAKVIKADILTSNGVAHAIDAVILPPEDVCEATTTKAAGNAVASAAYMAQGSFTFGAILIASLFA